MHHPTKPSDAYKKSTVRATICDADIVDIFHLGLSKRELCKQYTIIVWSTPIILLSTFIIKAP